jgi:murein DD-endopeptidase MepM/ murein hydrolase activator NlpD
VAGRHRRRGDPFAAKAALGAFILAVLTFAGIDALVPRPPAGDRISLGAVALGRPPIGQVPSPSAQERVKDPPEAFARWHGIELLLPTSRVLCICFHQASFRDTMPLEPLVGQRYVIMRSRGRPTALTSAVDIVTPRGTALTSPLDGKVTKVKPYRLYGRYRDMRLSIRPDADPDRRLVMIHVARIRVDRGDRVTAGETIIGVSRSFPFRSQTADYVPGHKPHVHMSIVDPDRAK